MVARGHSHYALEPVVLVRLQETPFSGQSIGRHRLIVANVRLVCKLAKDFEGRGVDYEDLVGDGILGLMRAVDIFDFQKYGTRFSTYATYWIKQAIFKGLMNTWQHIRIPAFMFQILARFRRAELALYEELGYDPDFNQVCQAMQLTQSHKTLVNHAIDSKKVVHRESWKRPDEEIWVDSNDDDIEEADFIHHLFALIRKLPERERTILILRYGLEGEKPQTLQAIAQRFGITREWVRRIEIQTFQRLWREIYPKPPSTIEKAG